MKFSLEQPEFLRIVQLSNSVIEKRNTVPVLSNLFLKVEKGKLHIAATDLEVFLTAELVCDLSEDGDVTVGLKQLHEILRELPANAVVTVSTKENHWLEIRSGKAFFQLMGLPGSDFPAVPSVSEMTFREFDVNTLLEMIDKTQFSVSTDETRYHLNGVFFTRAVHNGQRCLRMVSTDGHRLSMIDRSLDQDLESLEKGVIIPKKGLNEIRKLLTEVSGPLQFGIDQNRAVVKRGDIVLQIRLIEGDFPDCQKVIPKNNTSKVRLSREMFLASLKRISLLSNDASRTVTFTIRPGMMEIRSTNPNVGEAKEDIEVEYAGEQLQIGFNARYFIDVLNQLNTDDVELDLRDKLSPGILRSPKDDSYTAVVMPMRI